VDAELLFFCPICELAVKKDDGHHIGQLKFDTENNKMSILVRCPNVKFPPDSWRFVVGKEQS